MLNRVSDNQQCDNSFRGGGHFHAIQLGALLGSQPIATRLRDAVHRLIAVSPACGRPEIEFYDDISIDELPSELQTVVFPMVLELVLNACRHSGSETVLVGLAQDDKQVCIQVQDWGVGFDPASTETGKRGLRGVRDMVRWLGGTLEIDSLRGSGTCVMVEIPQSRETADPNIAQPHPEPRLRKAS
jgi:signal transduction histidine kinase